MSARPQRLAVRQRTDAGERTSLVERKPVGGQGAASDQYLEFWREQAQGAL